MLYTVIGVDNSIEEASLTIKDYPFDFIDTLKKFQATPSHRFFHSFKLNMIGTADRRNVKKFIGDTQ